MEPSSQETYGHCDKKVTNSKRDEVRGKTSISVERLLNLPYFQGEYSPGSLEEDQYFFHVAISQDGPQIIVSGVV